MSSDKRPAQAVSTLKPSTALWALTSSLLHQTQCCRVAWMHAWRHSLHFSETSHFYCHLNFSLLFCCGSIRLHLSSSPSPNTKRRLNSYFLLMRFVHKKQVGFKNPRHCDGKRMHTWTHVFCARVCFQSSQITASAPFHPSWRKCN